VSIFKNFLGAVVPVRERRQVFGALAALNNELVIPTNGDASVTVHAVSSAFIGTLEFTAACDNGGAVVNGAPVGSLYLPIAAFIDSMACVGGTIPVAAQPLITDALVAANTTRRYIIPCGGISSVRVRVSAYTSGNLELTANADVNDGVVRGIYDTYNTLAATATGAVGAASVLSMPAVAGFRHVVTSIKVTRSATAALTPSATPVVVTTTNLPGNLAITFGSDAAGVGIDKDEEINCGGGITSVAVNTATTVSAPAYAGVIWRINATYRLAR
jgi:hypothetical protein